jgi:hypothetical protein
VAADLGGGDVPDDRVTDVLSESMTAAVLDELGDRVAAVIATLRAPSAPPEASVERRPYVAAWSLIGEVVLGGGLAGGGVGDAVAARATRTLLACGLPVPPLVRASPHAPWLALIGAARGGSSLGDGVRLVLDGGQTAIKRGLARVEDGELVGLRVLPAFPFPSGADATAAVRDAAADAVGGSDPDSDVVVSVAAYVRDERPIVDRASPYEVLASGASEIEGQLQRRVRMVHDGTAAWRGLGSTSDRPSAVIAMGTWLGVGFGPQRQPLLPVSSAFALDSS